MILLYRFGLAAAIVAPWLWVLSVQSCHDLPQGCSWPRPAVPERCKPGHMVFDCYRATEATTWPD